MSERQYDSIIIGGGPAGLSAGLILGRSERNTLVCDSGEYRNAPAKHAHNYLTRDGTPPSELLKLGRRELDAYESVEYRPSKVTKVESITDGFAVTVEGAETVSTRTIILATGLSDILPAIEGLRDLWGSSVAHCPYCHGWEVRGESFAVYAPTAELLPYVKLLRQWSDDLTVLTDGKSWVDGETQKQLDANGISVIEDSVSGIKGTDTGVEIHFESGDTLSRTVFWVNPGFHQRSPLAESLGCSFTKDGFIETDGEGRSSVDGVYVAGDAGRERHQVSFAVSDGAIAGISINADLTMMDFESR